MDQGISFQGTVSNIIFEDCMWTAGEVNFMNNTATNIHFRNCVFDFDNGNNINLSAGSTTTVTLSNCIFDGFIEGNSSQNNTVLIDHCIFLETSGAPLRGVKNSSITNSIFMNVATIADGNVTGCAFINNISNSATTFPPAGNTGSGNLSSTNPNFVTYTLGTMYSTAHDYHLQAGSPAIGYGTDATDVGVHGGTTKFSEQGEPLNAPVMRSMQINTPAVAPNGTLNVDVSASKPDDD